MRSETWYHQDDVLFDLADALSGEGFGAWIVWDAWGKMTVVSDAEQWQADVVLAAVAESDYFAPYPEGWEI